MSKFNKFKEFLAEECGVLDMYKKGKYDRKIFNWFQKKELLKELSLCNDCFKRNGGKL